VLKAALCHTNEFVHFAGGTQDVDSRELRIVMLMTLGVICVVGFSGNLLVITVLINNARKGKTSMINSLILNLSMADLLIMLFCVPFRAVAYSKPSWALGWFICKTADWFLQCCLAVKSFTVAVLAKACFMYVTHPSKQVQIKHHRIMALITSIWGIAFILPIPDWLYATVKYETDKVLCVFEIPTYASDVMAVFAKVYPSLVYCLPMSFAFVYHWKAFRRCKRRGTKTQTLRNQIRGRRLTVMLFSVSLTFAAMWAPEWVAWVWMRHIQKNGSAPPLSFTLMAQMLVFTISSVNPLIFVAISEEFREGFKGLWKRMISRKSQRAPDVPGAQSQTNPESVPPDPAPTKEPSDSPSSKTGNIVLSDMEQFWHDRQNTPGCTEDDPIPWEHQKDSELPQHMEATGTI
uniref:GPCR-2037 n=1 Tax=Callorhinchus milii TaxID=7868 RepID=A0A4W3K7K9_CALMI